MYYHLEQIRWQLIMDKILLREIRQKERNELLKGIDLKDQLEYKKIWAMEDSAEKISDSIDRLSSINTHRARGLFW